MFLKRVSFMVLGERNNPTHSRFKVLRIRPDIRKPPGPSRGQRGDTPGKPGRPRRQAPGVEDGAAVPPFRTSKRRTLRLSFFPFSGETNMLEIFLTRKPILNIKSLHCRKKIAFRGTELFGQEQLTP